MKLLSYLFAVAPAHSSHEQANVSSAERRVAQAVKHEQERSVEILKRPQIRTWVRSGRRSGRLS